MTVATVTRGLALSCHPIPALAVTAITAGLCALAGLPLGVAIAVTATVFAGQLSIGWSNDYLDAARDGDAHRTDKPIAAGELERRVAGIAALVALGTSIVLSGLLGWQGALMAVGTTLCGWAYNLGIKATVLSWLPYAIAFGFLPAVVTLSADPPRWPAAWVMLSAALFGVAAHFANVLPDLEDDKANGVRGLPHHMGARAAAITAACLLACAATLVLVGPGTDPNMWRVLGFAATLVVTTLAVRLAYRDPGSPNFFRAVILIAGIVLVAFAVGGVDL